MATSPVGEECRIYADTRRKQRKDEYKRLAKIQRKIERRKNVPVFDDAKLAEVLVVRGSPFDIDQDDPIDLEPRFFLPGPVDLMEQGLESNTVEWCRLEPLHYHALKNDDIYFTQAKIYADEIMTNARQRGGFCQRAAREVYGWKRML